MDNNVNDTLEEIIITIDTGKWKINCSVINTYEIGKQSYIALMPHNTEEILLFRYKELDGNDIEIINIEDNEEFCEALNVFDSLMVDIERENNKIE